MYQNEYKVDPPITPEELFVEVMRVTLSYLFTTKMIKPEPKHKIKRARKDEEEDVLNYWRDIWVTLAVKAGLSDSKIKHFLSVGQNTISNLYNQFRPRFKVAATNIPWVSEWPKERIEGTILAVVKGGVLHVSDIIYVIDCLPAYDSYRDSAPARQVFSLLSEAALGVGAPGAEVRVQLIDPFTGNISEVVPSRGGSHTIIAAILKQIRYALALPHFGSHCESCPFKKTCHPSYCYNIYSVKELEGKKIEEGIV